MIIYKRFLLLNEVDNSGCSAIIKFENFQNTTLGNIKVIGKKDKYELVINFNGKIECIEVLDDQSFDLKKQYDLSTFIQAILIKNKDVISNGSTNGSNQPYSSLLNEVIKEDEKMEEGVFEEKEDVIVETSYDNKKEDIEIKKIEPKFYKKVKRQLDEMFSMHMPDDELNSIIEDSKWIRVIVSSENYYVVGIIYEDGVEKYICYGVPDKDDSTLPKEDKEFAKYLKIDDNHGYWMMYQSAEDGVTLLCDSI